MTMLEVVAEVLDLHRKGATVMFAHAHTGSPKIKVRYGFLHLRTKRFSVDSATMTEVKDRLLASRKKDAASTSE